MLELRDHEERIATIDRSQEHEKSLKSLIEKLMKGYDFEIDPDPKAESFFSNFHKWIQHGEKSPKRTMERCQILNKISRFVLEIINSDTSKEDKEEWTHLFCNMAAVFDLLKI